jgi:hypothetical protein
MRALNEGQGLTPELTLTPVAQFRSRLKSANWIC